MSDILKSLKIFEKVGALTILGAILGGLLLGWWGAVLMGLFGWGLDYMFKPNREGGVV